MSYPVPHSKPSIQRTRVFLDRSLFSKQRSIQKIETGSDNWHLPDEVWVLKTEQFEMIGHCTSFKWNRYEEFQFK